MLIVVTGGSGSGKSVFAEKVAQYICKDKKIYIATMIAYDQEAKEKIEKHRKQREHKGFCTMEVPTHIEKVNAKGETCILLECISNLVANEMYSTTGVKSAVVTHMMHGIRTIKKQVNHLVIVTNEVFSGIEEHEETREYVGILGKVNQELVKEAEVVVEIVYGIPIFHKGDWDRIGGIICKD